MRAKHDWVALIAEQARSGLTQKAFCAQHGIHPVSFSQARRKVLTLRNPAREIMRAPEHFVRVMPSASAGAARLELSFGALTLRFDPVTPPAVVAALVEALA